MSLAILCALAISCFDIVTGLEHWPFGSYPMYSVTYHEQLSWLRLYGVTNQGEVALRGERDFAPFDEARLIMALQRLQGARGADGGNQNLDQALCNLMHLYNRGAARRQPASPPLHALRLYALQWDLRPGLQGSEAPRERNLMAQVSEDGPER